MKTTCLFQTFPNSGEIRITVSVVTREERKNTMLKNSIWSWGMILERESWFTSPCAGTGAIPVTGAQLWLIP